MPTSFEPLQISFVLEGELYYDPQEPPMLDGILSWLLLPFKKQGEERKLEKDGQVDEITLPLAIGERNGVRLWKASALFPDHVLTDGLRYWRKRGRTQYMHLLHKSICTTNGACRDYNVPMPVISTNRLICWCVGNKALLKKELRRLKYIGKKRSQGVGRVSSYTVDHIEKDYSWTKDGMATRWLPDENGNRLVRPRPPYWNMTERVACCEVGDIVA